MRGRGGGRTSTAPRSASPTDLTLVTSRRSWTAAPAWGSGERILLLRHLGHSGGGTLVRVLLEQAGWAGRRIRDHHRRPADHAGRRRDAPVDGAIFLGPGIPDRGQLCSPASTPRWGRADPMSVVPDMGHVQPGPTVRRSRPPARPPPRNSWPAKGQRRATAELASTPSPGSTGRTAAARTAFGIRGPTNARPPPRRWPTRIHHVFRTDADPRT